MTIEATAATETALAKRPRSVAAKNFDLVILDCDGVLIDSEVISMEAVRAALAAYGLDVDLAHVRKTYLGRSFSAIAEDFRRRTGRALPPQFEAEFLQRLFAAYRRELRAMAGVEELMAAIPCDYCVATSSRIDRAELSLDVTGLAPLFRGKIFYAGMVARGKPAPDLFLHAARAFGADPARCLVIEDSDIGVLSAQNAGMPVWRFVGGSHCAGEWRPQAPGADEPPTFASMAAMAAALRNG